MNDALVVSGIQRRRYLPDHVDGGFDRQATHAAQAMVEIFTVEVFHDQVGLAGFRLPEVDDGHKVRVPEM